MEVIDALAHLRREVWLQFDNAEVRREVIDFFITREKVALRDAGVKADTIDAVLACGIEEPIVLARRARALEAAPPRTRRVMDDLATAFARANNLREIGLGTGDVDAELLTEVGAGAVGGRGHCRGQCDLRLRRNYRRRPRCPGGPARAGGRVLRHHHGHGRGIRRFARTA